MILAGLRIWPLDTKWIINHAMKNKASKQGERWGGRWTISNSHASQISWYGLLLCTSITNMKVLCHYAGSSSLSRSTSMHVHHRYLGLSSLCRSFFIMHVHSTLTRNHSLIEENLHYILVVDEIKVSSNK